MESCVVGDVWTSDEAFKNLSVLCDDFGSRFAGTEGERAAVDFMVSKLREYGLENVAADEFTYTGWRRGEARLEMINPLERRLETISLALCPPTPDGGVEGEVVHLGAGYPENFRDRKDEIEGKIVLCSSQPRPSGEMVHRRTKYGYAVDLGAIGFIFMNHNPGQLMPTGSLRPGYRMAGEIPGIGVSKETGSFVVRQFRKGPLRVRITTTDRVEANAVSWNVVGEIPGKEPDNLIIVGAHFDGHDIAQGALDDGAGAVSIMEAARALAKFKGSYRSAIRFVCFAAEEIGVTGSTCYVDKHRNEIYKVKLMINCDGAGSGLRHEFGVHGPQELVQCLQNLVDQIGYDMNVKASKMVASDHWPFYMQGIPSATLSVHRDPSEVARLGRGWGHTSADTLDKVDPKGLKDAAMLLARTLIRISNDPAIIPKRTPPEEIARQLEEKGLADTLRIQKKWHPASIR